MDIKLILGPNNSGKSLYAETLATQYATAPLIYLATMIPQTEENNRRIKKHKQQRTGKGFHTIEEPWELPLLHVPSNAVVLLEDASNLLANGMFLHHSDVTECYRRILSLAEHCQCLIIVSIAGLCGDDYDEETKEYIRQLNLLNQLLKETATDCMDFS